MGQWPLVSVAWRIAAFADGWGWGIHPYSSGGEPRSAGYLAGQFLTNADPASTGFGESLPLSVVGKVLKTALRKPFWPIRRHGVA
ncbi:hypothetical protein D9M71_699680 [compost metagenome]